MLGRSPDNATRASLDSYVAFLNADVDRRLGELARYVQESGASYRDLDGSPASLVPLWAWVRREVRRGVPDAARDPVVSRARFFEFTLGETSTRIAWLAQCACAYLLFVARQVDPTIRWGLEPPDPDGLRTVGQSEPGFLSDRYEFWMTEHLIENKAEFAIELPSATSDSDLFTQFVEHYPESDWTELNFTAPDWGALADLPADEYEVPRVQWRVSVGAGAARPAVETLGLRSHRGLSSEKTVGLLSDLGALSVEDSRRLEESDLERDGVVNYVAPAIPALLELTIVGRRLRELRFLPSGANAETWQALEARLPFLAKRFRMKVADVGT